jgi:alpha-beta hydrolase superfamily lysophospholipase
MMRKLAASAALIALAGAAHAQTPALDQKLPPVPKATLGDLPSRSAGDAIDQQVNRLVAGPVDATMAVDSGNEDGAFLYGSYRKPDNLTHFPAVLILPAAGADRNGNAAGQEVKPDTYRQLAEALAAKGIASLRIDKRGVGASAKAITREDDLRFETYVDDAVTWTKFLQAQPGVGCMAIFGHSEGALVAALAAKKVKVCAIIEASGSGKPASALLAEQLKTAADAKRLDKDTYDQAAKILDQLAAGKPVADPPAKLNQLFRPSVQPYLISWLPLNPVDALKTSTPVLILQGSSDGETGAEDTRRLSASPTKVVKVVMITGADHDLKLKPLSASKSAIDAPRSLSPQVATAIKSFLDVIKWP